MLTEWLLTYLVLLALRRCEHLNNNELLLFPWWLTIVYYC